MGMMVRDEPLLDRGKVFYLDGEIWMNPQDVDEMLVRHGSLDAVFDRVNKRIQAQINASAASALRAIDERCRRLDKRDTFAWLYGAAGGPPLRTHGISQGFRSIDVQQELYRRRNEPGSIFAVRPGQSVHGGHRAVDTDGLWHVTDFETWHEPWHYQWDRPKRSLWKRSLWWRIKQWFRARVRFDQ